jgi:hypothetical protein
MLIFLGYEGCGSRIMQRRKYAKPTIVKTGVLAHITAAPISGDNSAGGA